MEKMQSNKWNGDYISKSQTKAIEGLCAMGIVFHHMAQKTCASWIPHKYIVHGLDLFLNVGYLLVGIFFFYSGYGLYKSVKSNPDYLNKFLGRHISPIVLLYLIAVGLFRIIGNQKDNYVWFVYAIIWIYISFFFCFKFIKKEILSIGFLALAVFLYVAVCDFLNLGTWWYNSAGVFFAGLFFSKFEKNTVEFLKKNYTGIFVAVVILFIISFYGAFPLNNLIYSALPPYSVMFRWLTAIVQTIAALMFSIIVLLMCLKIKIKWKPLVFLGNMSLEIYLFHVLFVEIFGYGFVDSKAICYIRNVLLYVLAVLSSSLIASATMHQLKKAVCNLRKKLKTFL